jgi:hypothetical protein
VYRQFIGKRDHSQETPRQAHPLCPKNDNDRSLATLHEWASERLECTSPWSGTVACAEPDFQNMASAQKPRSYPTECDELSCIIAELVFWAIVGGHRSTKEESQPPVRAKVDAHLVSCRRKNQL